MTHDNVNQHVHLIHDVLAELEACSFVSLYSTFHTERGILVHKPDAAMMKHASSNLLSQSTGAGVNSDLPAYSSTMT